MPMVRRLPAHGFKLHARRVQIELYSLLIVQMIYFTIGILCLFEVKLPWSGRVGQSIGQIIYFMTGILCLFEVKLPNELVCSSVSLSVNWSTS